MEKQSLQDTVLINWKSPYKIKDLNQTLQTQISMQKNVGTKTVDILDKYKRLYIFTLIPGKISQLRYQKLKS